MKKVSYRVIKLLRSIRNVQATSTRLNSSSAKMLPLSELNDYDFSANNPKKHPGILPQKCKELPPDCKEAIIKVTRDTPLKQLLSEGKKLFNYLQSRHPSMSHEDLHRKKSEIILDVKESYREKNPNTDLSSIIDREIKKKMYHWHPLDFKRHLGLVYLFSRSAPEYAVLCRVLGELKLLAGFTPKSIFDFGSGVGTVTWAAEEIWPGSSNENYCVDVSPDMVDMAREVAESAFPRLSGRLFFRQFSPSVETRKFDLVVASHSLFELHYQLRLRTIADLWARTKQYLVIVEQGTLPAFKVISEARDIILEEINSKPGSGYLFAPCPHSGTCPLKGLSSCHFSVPYVGFLSSTTARRQHFSYIIFSRVSRPNRWPRVVKPVIRHSRHTILRLCNPTGELSEVNVTPSKYKKEIYKCARATQWGDLFPFPLNKVEKEET